MCFTNSARVALHAALAVVELLYLTCLHGWFEQNNRKQPEKGFILYTYSCTLHRKLGNRRNMSLPGQGCTFHSHHQHSCTEAYIIE